jgi:tetratricopeptide (TPR) repeat protein
MRERKRSEGARRAAFGWIIAGVLGLVAGCKEMEAIAPDMEDVVRPNRLHYEETNLSPSALEDRMREIDAQFAEPRTPGKVYVSYEASLSSISRVNDYAALWRGTRACAWLARNHPERSQRQAYARKGIAMGREATEKTSKRVESWYYLALSLGAHAEIQGTPNRDTIREMREAIQWALALDNRYDDCGPHRFMGLLMVKSDAYPLYAVGTIKEGLEHLKKAVEMCPDYGENHLAYAEALKDDGQHDLARAELEKVIASMKPKDRTAEHDAWLEKANELMQDLQGS